MGAALALWEAAEVAEVVTRARWAEHGSSSSLASPGLPSLAQLVWCSCFPISSWSVAAEWALVFASSWLVTNT